MGLYLPHTFINSKWSKDNKFLMDCSYSFSMVMGSNVLSAEIFDFDYLNVCLVVNWLCFILDSLLLYVGYGCMLGVDVIFA
jgi:hypothetical protein